MAENRTKYFTGFLGGPWQRNMMAGCSVLAMFVAIGTARSELIVGANGRDGGDGAPNQHGTNGRSGSSGLPGDGADGEDGTNALAITSTVGGNGTVGDIGRLLGTSERNDDTIIGGIGGKGGVGGGSSYAGDGGNGEDGADAFDIQLVGRGGNGGNAGNGGNGVGGKAGGTGAGGGTGAATSADDFLNAGNIAGGAGGDGGRGGHAASGGDGGDGGDGGAPYPVRDMPGGRAGSGGTAGYGGIGGDGGWAGAGGLGLRVVSGTNVINTGTIAGGKGGVGGSGGYGGNGGRGGEAGYGYNSQGDFVSGRGGGVLTRSSGASGGAGGSGGLGGTGGIGIESYGQNELINRGAILGGDGGDGGNGATGGRAGQSRDSSQSADYWSGSGGNGYYGGRGGAGVLAHDESTIVNEGEIRGGNGGNGGQGGQGANGPDAGGQFDSLYAGNGGNGGVGGNGGWGGDAVSLGNDSLLKNFGTISGGIGGRGGLGGAAGQGGEGVDGPFGKDPGLDGAVGKDGEASPSGRAVYVDGDNTKIVNAETGILAAGGGSDDIAVQISGSDNTLELHAGSVIDGLVSVTGNNNTLVLGGDGSAISSVTLTDGFDHNLKTGTSTWTLKPDIGLWGDFLNPGPGPTRHDWTIEDGTLQSDISVLKDVYFTPKKAGQSPVLDVGSVQTIQGDRYNHGIPRTIQETSFSGIGVWFYEMPGNISGNGTVVKSDSTFIILSGNNTYTGGTIISGGYIEATKDSALGDISGGLTFDGGSLHVYGSDWTETSRSIMIGSNGGTISVDPGHEFSLNGLITGGGRLTVNGNGSVIVNGANDYTGGTVLGIGKLTGRSDSFGSGDIRVGDKGTLTIDQDDDGELARSISGEGDFAKNGSGTLTLSGANTYSGTTTVSQGSLVVNGSTALSSQTTVETGATLAGYGTVGNTTISDGGHIAPGNAHGPLTVAGDLVLSSESILDFELGSAGASVTTPGTSSRVNVTGDLDLNGTLNLAQSGSGDGQAGLGYYRLMTYGGVLSGDGLTVGQTPNVDNAGYLIDVDGGNVDLFIASAGDDTLQHWQGGDGVWSATNSQWLNKDGEFPVSWAGNYAVFKNEPGGFDGGTISMDGAQSFKGLQFVDDGYRLEGDGALETVAEGSEIRVLADSAEIATDIAGVGGIVKTEGGTLILSGNNTYEGGAVLGGGTLSISSDANLGDASGTLTFNGGVLQVTGTEFGGTEREIAWGAQGGGFDISEASNYFHVGQNIVGGGDLLKTGRGSLRLTGDNAYGNTLIAKGQVFGNAASISGNVGNAGTVVFVQETDDTFAGDIGSFDGTAGNIVKQGMGNLELTGASSLDWTIESGGVVTAAERFRGDAGILRGASLTFDQSIDAAYDGVFYADGRFIKAGAAVLAYNGISHDFTGTSDILGGALIVGSDADHADALLGGSFNVEDGGTLGGHGTVGTGAGSVVTIASGGTLAPGNSIGTLTVDGNLVFEAGSRFAVEVDPNSTDSDLVTVTGDATLNGGAVAHIGANGNYDLRSTYTILSADGALAGAFDTVSSDFAFLTSNLAYDYDAGTVDLNLERNDRDFASVALTRNQKATAGGIESIGLDAGHPVYDAIAQLADDDDLIRASFDALSGEIHGSAKSVLIEDSRFVRNTANDRIRAAFGNVGASAAPVLAYGPGGLSVPVSPDHAGPVFWSHGFGSWGSTDSDGNAADLQNSTGGLLIGADTFAGDWRIGLLAGYSHSNFKTNDRASEGSSENYHLGLYGGTKWGSVAFRSGIAYSWHDIETNRNALLPGLRDSLNGDYNAGTFQAFGEIGYGFEAGETRLEPFANLAYVNLHTDSFTESGGAAALSILGQTTETTFTTVGLRGEHAVQFDAIDVTLTGMISWQHAFGNTTPESTHAFSAGDAFTIAGIPIAEDAAVIETGLGFNLTDNATMGVFYAGQLASRSQEHGFKANLNMRF